MCIHIEILYLLMAQMLAIIGEEVFLTWNVSFETPKLVAMTWCQRKKIVNIVDSWHLLTRSQNKIELEKRKTPNFLMLNITVQSKDHNFWTTQIIFCCRISSIIRKDIVNHVLTKITFNAQYSFFFSNLTPNIQRSISKTSKCIIRFTLPLISFLTTTDLQ